MVLPQAKMLLLVPAVTAHEQAVSVFTALSARQNLLADRFTRLHSAAG